MKRKLQLNKIIPHLKHISDAYSVDIDTYVIWVKLRVDDMAYCGITHNNEVFYEFLTNANESQYHSRKILVKGLDELDLIALYDQEQKKFANIIESKETPVESNDLTKGWVIGILEDDDIKILYRKYDLESDVDQRLEKLAKSIPNTTFVKLEIQAYVTTGVVWK